jgi:glycosyltransferase involved in cell wall biosynthesis
VIGYCGSLVTRDVIEKGVRELIDALALLSKRGTSFQGWIVGGPIEWVERYRRLAEELGLRGQVRFEGAVPTADVSSALHACDVLVYPSPASSLPYFLRDTSPLKIFEYLAAGKPIVAADLPPIRDLLSEEEATFCHPGDPASLADALTHVLTNASEAAAKALRGIALVAKHSWEERMGRILQRLPIVSPR